MTSSTWHVAWGGACAAWAVVCAAITRSDRPSSLRFIAAAARGSLIRAWVTAQNRLPRIRPRRRTQERRQLPTVLRGA
jgi:hypothetical protein